MLIVDTGPFLAIADSADPDHRRCLHLLQSHRGPLVTSALVVAEAGWLIRRQLDSEAESLFYTSLATGEILVEHLIESDWARIATLVDQYSDIGLDAADASLVAIAERLNQSVIATLDHRDFRIIRPNHVESFELVPGPN